MSREPWEEDFWDRDPADQRVSCLMFLGYLLILIGVLFWLAVLR